MKDNKTTPIAVEEEVITPAMPTAAEAREKTEQMKLALYEHEHIRIYNKIDSESSNAGDTVDSVFHRNMPEDAITQLITVLEADGYKVVKQKDAKAIKVSW